MVMVHVIFIITDDYLPAKFKYNIVSFNIFYSYTFIISLCEIIINLFPLYTHQYDFA